MLISRVWAMPSRWTFEIKPIAKLLEKYEVGKGWIDPFAGKSKLCEVRNDMNPELEQPNCFEAHEFLSSLKGPFQGAIFDPPYSKTQVVKAYKNIGLSFQEKHNQTGSFPKEKDIINSLIKPDGIVISFGWHTNAMGKKRNFQIIEVLMVAHGGNRNDTLCTVERKLS